MLDFQVKINILEHSKFFGYQRAGSFKQEQAQNYSLDNQSQELKRYGVPAHQIFSETGSRELKITERPVLHDLLNSKMQKGDILCVSKLDRCVRNTREFIYLQNLIFKKGVHFIAFDLPYYQEENVPSISTDACVSGCGQFVLQRFIEALNAASKETLSKILKDFDYPFTNKEINYIFKSECRYSGVWECIRQLERDAGFADDDEGNYAESDLLFWMQVSESVWQLY